jgi:tetratricopeptide (TPR) repeat protein
MSHTLFPRVPLLRLLAAPLAVFATVTAVLLIVNASPSRTREDALDSSPIVAAESDADSVGGPALFDTEAQIASFQRLLRQGPNTAAYAGLGDAYYQRARETGDPAFYSRSERAFGAALARDPEDVDATIGLGTLALARHDFARGLALGLRAHRLEPGLARPYTVIVDGEIELGRYAAAAVAIDRLARLKPNLAAYTRVSYFRELQGDLDGAVRAMRLAVSAGGTVEGSAYVNVLLGGLEFDRGNYAAAERSYREALTLDPGYPPAIAGRARVDASRGHLLAAVHRYRRAVEALPLPEYATALAEVEQAAGMKRAAEGDLALVEAQAKLFEARGVDTGVEQALFEADHGDPARAVAAGRRAWLRAPSVRSADAYSWALHAAGRAAAAERLSRQAMRLGSRAPTFLYHAGMIALASGDRARARADLALLVRQSPRFHPIFGPRARRALEDLQ